MPNPATDQTNANQPAEASVYDRYSDAAQRVEPALCCPVEYSADLLKIIPPEVIERDYGCGDPSPYLSEGDVVLDLGSGGGKLCFIAAQIVGPTGKVIGVDCNLEMLNLARKHAPTVSEQLGYSNLDFRYGMIQDLKLDLQLLENELANAPVRNADDFVRLRHVQEELCVKQPLVTSNSVDCVVSNCVLNLVRNEDRQQLFAELYRVLKPGGRAAISDIVSDQDVPEEMQQDPELWSGCLSGAFREDKFMEAFERAGFLGLQLAKRVAEPWQTVNGIEFRSVTIVAYKPAAPDQSLPGSLVYRGPFKHITDDAGNHFTRGANTPVSGETFSALSQPPYSNSFFQTSQSGAQCSDSNMKELGVLNSHESDTCCGGGHGCC